MSTVKAVAYLRVSTEEQAKANSNGTGFGLAVQRDQVVAWAARERRVIVGWHIDAGKSGGAGLEVRVALGQALDALIDKRATELVVPELGRLSRDLMLQEMLLNDIRNAGGRLRSCEAEEDRLCEDGGEDDPTRKLVRQIMGAIKEYDRAMIRLRLMRGIQRKKRAGGYTGGTLGYGVEVRDGLVVAVESPVKDRLMELRGQGLTFEVIAATLNAEGLLRDGGLWIEKSANRAFTRWDRLAKRR